MIIWRDPRARARVPAVGSASSTGEWRSRLARASVRADAMPPVPTERAFHNEVARRGISKPAQRRRAAPAASRVSRRLDDA
jgi:hypothetical protein